VIHPGETQLRHRILIRDAEGRPAARVRTLGLDMRAILPALGDPPRRAELHRMIRAQLTP
jgi:hypothetical protein